MSFFGFIFSKIFIKQIFWIGIISVLIILSALFAANRFTKHNKEYQVENFLGMNANEALSMSTEGNLRFHIVDSIFSDKYPPGSIANQDPLPESFVKEGRKIYLTVVSIMPEMVKMPDLRSNSLRMALAQIETFGLKVGKKDYIPSFEKNAVIEQHFDGEEIKPETLLPKGSRIDLVLGSGLSGERIPVPNIMGLKKSEARAILDLAGLNIGNEIFEGSQDTSMVRIYKQVPYPTNSRTSVLGQTVDLWYMPESEFDFQEKQKEFQIDTNIIIETDNTIDTE